MGKGILVMEDASFWFNGLQDFYRIFALQFEIGVKFHGSR
jgi:hypothetical protein